MRLEEEIFQGLGIPYSVIDICTGDLGGPAYRKFDLEAWMPGRGEGASTAKSPAPRTAPTTSPAGSGLRYKMPDEKGTQFVHTLNGTAIACTRALIAMLENYQQADGSIVVPEVLRSGWAKNGLEWRADTLGRTAWARRLNRLPTAVLASEHPRLPLPLRIPGRALPPLIC